MDMRHIFESSEDHPFNRPEGKLGNCRGFPNMHTCLCGKTVWKELEHSTHPPFSEMMIKIYGEN